jgi:hypothetical protein
MAIKLTVVIVNVMLLLPTIYKIVSNILVWRLSYLDEIIGYHQCGFQPNRSTTDQIFCIRQILDTYGSIMGQYIIYKFWEGLWFSQERSGVQNSRWIWYHYETV